MLPIKIAPEIYWVGVNDRKTVLFEGLWPIEKEGVSYNSYLIRDEKNILIDLVNENFADEYLEKLRSLIDLSKLDYVVINHMEADHSSGLQSLLQVAPQVKILTSEKARGMLAEYFDVHEAVQTVKDGEELDAGQHKLRFVYTPFVHWPETMMTYEINHQILFSCDGFGGYGALPGTIFSDQVPNLDEFIQESLRYYTNIVATVSKPVIKAVEKLSGTPVSIVAPSHGLVWRKDPQQIINLFREWADYATNPGQMGVTLIFGSMYGSTGRMVEAVAQGVASEGLPIKVFEVSFTHASYILPWLWTQRGVLIASPTYEGGLFPSIRQFLDLAGQKHVHGKTAGYFGSYTWGGGARRQMETLAEGLRWNLAASYDYSGFPRMHELEKGREFGENFARLLKAG